MDTAAALLGAFEAARSELSSPAGEDPWANSPFAWIREMQSRRRGKAGEIVITHWLQGEGFAVGRSASSDSDRSIGLHQVEIKLSTQWEDGQFVFQQIRNQDYRFMILLGITPTEAKVWILPKKVALRHSTPQHTGRTGAETRWLSFEAANPPAWMSRYGGSVESGLKAITRYLATPTPDTTPTADTTPAADTETAVEITPTEVQMTPDVTPVLVPDTVTEQTHAADLSGSTPTT